MAKSKGKPFGPAELEGLILTYLREEPGRQVKYLLARISLPKTRILTAVHKLYTAGRIRRFGDSVPYAWEINPDHAIERALRDRTGGKDEKGKTQGWIE